MSTYDRPEVHLHGDRSTGTIHYMEVKKDFINLFFGITGLPLGKLVRILEAEHNRKSSNLATLSRTAPALLNLLESRQRLEQGRHRFPNRLQNRAALKFLDPNTSDDEDQDTLSPLASEVATAGQTQLLDGLAILRCMAPSCNNAALSQQSGNPVILRCPEHGCILGPCQVINFNSRIEDHGLRSMDPSNSNGSNRWSIQSDTNGSGTSGLRVNANHVDTGSLGPLTVHAENNHDQTSCQTMTSEHSQTGGVGEDSRQERSDHRADVTGGHRHGILEGVMANLHALVPYSGFSTQAASSDHSESSTTSSYTTLRQRHEISSIISDEQRTEDSASVDTELEGLLQSERFFITDELHCFPQSRVDADVLQRLRPAEGSGDLREVVVRVDRRMMLLLIHNILNNSMTPLNDSFGSYFKTNMQRLIMTSWRRMVGAIDSRCPDSLTDVARRSVDFGKSLVWIVLLLLVEIVFRLASTFGLSASNQIAAFRHALD